MTPQLTAVSVESLAARPGFAVAVKAAGAELIPEDVMVAESGRSRTAYDVDVPRGVNNLPEPPSPIFVGRAEAMAGLERALAVHLLIDRDDCTVTVFTEPEDGRCRRQLNKPFGVTVELPDPVNITLDSEPLKEFAD